MRDHRQRVHRIYHCAATDPEEPCEHRTPSVTAEYGSTSTLSTVLPQIPEEVHGRQTPQLTVDCGSTSPISWARATEAQLAELGHV